MTTTPDDAASLMSMGGEMEGQHAEPDGRKVVYSSLNHVKLLRNADKFIYILLAVLLVLVLVEALIVCKIRRRK